MIKREDLEEGKFVWWTAERMFKAWSVPCKVIKAPFKPDPEKEWERFVLLSLDDMKETELSVGGETYTDELKASTFADAKAYLNRRKAALKKTVIDVETQLENAKEAVINYEKKMNEILS
jgi:hypothetical protein